MINPLSMFYQFGYKEFSKKDEHSLGRCPFCGDEKHFYINIEHENKTWDCKKCGMSGGYKKFLENIIEKGIKHFDKKSGEALCKDRGLSMTTFATMNVGYLPYNNVYLIPVYGYDGKTVINIKIFNPKEKGLRNTNGLTSAMYGLWKLNDKANTVLIAEGEWDALTLIECTIKLKLKDVNVIGVPGAGTFKEEVLPFLNGKNVYMFYDNDLAGNNGATKVEKILSPITNKLFKIEWPKNTPSGYDIRDIYTKECKQSAKLTYDKIMQLSREVQTIGGQVKTVVGTKPPVDCQKIYEGFKKHLHLKDTNLLDVIFGTVIANRMQGDPVWMFIVAPPGGTKTEPLLSLSGAADIYTTSSFSAATLISGMNHNGNDPSLIPKLNGKILVMKDFTTMLSLPSFERDKIFGILRDAYDGTCQRDVGNGVVRVVQSKFGFIAGVTPMIELFTSEQAGMGERFLRYNHDLPDSYAERMKYIRKAMENVGNEDVMRKELLRLGQSVLEGKYDMTPEFTEEMNERLENLSVWISKMRAMVIRDKYYRDIIHKSTFELGTRVGKTLRKLLIGIAQFKQEKIVSEETFRIILDVAKSSVLTRNYLTVYYMYQRGENKLITVKEIQNSVKLPNSTCDLILEDLEALNVVQKEIGTDHKTHWKIENTFYRLMRFCRF